MEILQLILKRGLIIFGCLVISLPQPIMAAGRGDEGADKKDKKDEKGEKGEEERKFYHKDDLIRFNLPPVTVPVIYKKDLKLYYNFIFNVGFDDETQAQRAFDLRIWLCDRIFTDLFVFFSVMWKDEMQTDIAFVAKRVKNIINDHLGKKYEVKNVKMIVSKAHYRFDKYLEFRKKQKAIKAAKKAASAKNK